MERRDTIRVLEMPGPIDALRSFGGRVYADVGGRTIDITDWFADAHPRPN